ncbi:TPA: helix-turn-helix transcriptional regulator [Streptococcus agalactiae]|uniref:helix-turn-helix domain-containing protein n=1 Tax=Streptococcus agalactiae TaxID=1311 RepID=UPI00255234C7|nr:helix-turn-helix transcriptional regulator [Streptococcus agalactiae]MDK6300943.1 helix-turn-helix transcriptional regulator [Streptococcus agalactiae]HEN3191461.1 helix-turn-helix transcriptional regulator [Streptococcus agalactiae]HEN3201988.1 helix-turn-helix transcriptional regulator [Streptococcus agalactiae]
MKKLTNFGENLRLMRKTKSLTQKEIAPLLGIKQNTYSDWETGKSEPNLENVVKLAKLFKTTTDFLLGVTDD